MNPFSHTGLSISDSLKSVRKSVLIYETIIGLNGIISAYKAGCQNVYEIADYLNVTEEFLSEAISCYRQKYGVYAKLDNHVIYFEPTICVFELLESNNEKIFLKNCKIMLCK